MSKTNQTRVITVEQAELKTASVEIRHVVVNARKMTLSVFRQIPYGELIIENGEEWSLAGIPWGIVNYYWGNMDQSKPHVLWQAGTELRRALIHKPRGIKQNELLPSTRYNPNRDLVRLLYKEDDVVIVQYEVQQRFTPSTEEFKPLVPYSILRKPVTDFKVNQTKEVYDWLNEIECTRKRYIAETADRENKRREKYNELADGLTGLPQLFIAV